MKLSNWERITGWMIVAGNTAHAVFLMSLGEPIWALVSIAGAAIVLGILLVHS